ncbi:MAG: selenide, water dikinase SelD [candidate division WOR-3 bacterium]
MSKAQLARGLANLLEIKDPNLLVGMNTSDDAGVYKLSDDFALVLTVDLLAPVVEDPYTFGMIAATNCISDIYAMGGEPKLALNVIGYPEKGDPAILGKILAGGQAKAKEAGVVICGGHTFNTEGIMYGLSVVGYIHPKRIITNANARVGDVILLTKPIGAGTIIQAILLEKTEGIDPTQVIEGMTTLNQRAAQVMREIGVDAATDITGYGLAGHLIEMAEASKVSIELWGSKIPVYNGAIEIIRRGVIEPGINMNFNSFKDRVSLQNVTGEIGRLIFGSETSGGLAIVLPEEKVQLFLDKYQKSVRVIGRITKENPGQLKVLP